MRTRFLSHVVSLKSQRANRWQPEEDFVLMMLVGKVPYAQIALRLGRTKHAVEHRASKKGYSQRQEQAGDRETHKNRSEALREASLRLTEDDLAEFLPDCDDDPVLPHYGTRVYWREKQRKYLGTAEENYLKKGTNDVRL